MPTLRKPRAVRLGATVGIAAPAGPVDPERLEEGEAMLRELGFEPVRRADLTARCGYLAGDDARRAAELMELVEDPRVAAIVCARGGYGCHRIVSHLDAARVRKAAKPLVGYSDISTLLLWQLRCAGLTGFHGPMLERGKRITRDARDSLVRGLTGQKWSRRLPGKPLAGGWGEGRLVGGSLSVVAASLGTPWALDARGCILLLEEVNEKPFRIDRALHHLGAAGALDGLAGVGIGALTDCTDDRYPEPSASAVIAEILRPLGVPIVTDLPFGHLQANLLWPFGGRAAIDGDRGEIELLEAGVSTR